MTDLEDRLRDELSELAAVAQPDTIRPLRHLAPRRRAAAARFLAPAAAMVAVAAVAIAGAVIARALPHRGAAPVPATPELVRSGAVPRFYVLAYQSFEGGKVVTYAAVHSTATGRTLARVILPGTGNAGPSITGADDGRTFLVTQTNMTTRVQSIVWLLRLQVSASGRSIKVARLPVHVPSGMVVDDIALSPDGTRVVMTAQWDCGSQRCQRTGIRVVDLATGAVTAWSTHVNGAPFNGSWAGDHAVTFEWQPAAHGQTASYRVLPLSPGITTADLLLASEPIGSPPTEPNSYVPNALVTPDGKTVITSEVTPVTHLLFRGTVARIVALNARTGRVERTLYTVSTQDQSEILDQECNVVSLGPGGKYPLVNCFSGLGALIDGHIVSLPGFPSPSSSGIAGQQAIAW